MTEDVEPIIYNDPNQTLGANKVDSEITKHKYSSGEIARLIDSYVSFVGNSLNNPHNPIPSGEEAELRWWEQRCRLCNPLEKVSLPQLIEAIGEFPVLPLMLDSNPTNMCIIQGMKVPSQALSWLLKPLMLGAPLSLDMPFEVWSYYGLAQISKARFREHPTLAEILDSK